MVQAKLKHNIQITQKNDIHTLFFIVPLGGRCFRDKRNSLPYTRNMPLTREIYSQTCFQNQIEFTNFISRGI